MSRVQELHKPFLTFGNPFRLVSPKKSSRVSPKLHLLLSTFEETLDARIRKLKPAERQDTLPLSWMIFAVESLCGVYSDIINLITALELPVSDWDSKWIEVYLDNSKKLLDICNAFSSEISRLKQGHLFLRCALHNLDAGSEKQKQALASLDAWKQHMSKKNSRLDDCFTVMTSLVQMLDQPKVKNSTKGKVLMRALYGVKVLTITVCSILAATFSASTKKLIDLPVSETYLWSKSFADLQAYLNKEIRKSMALKELEAVDSSVKTICPFVKGDTVSANGETLQALTSDLRKSSENLSEGMHLLAEEMDRFFRVVLAGRDTLLSNLRACNGFPTKLDPLKKEQPLLVT